MKCQKRNTGGTGIIISVSGATRRRLFREESCARTILNDVCDAITKEGNLSMFNAERKKNGMWWLKAEHEEGE